MILLLFLLIAALSIAIDTFRLGISPMPTSKKTRNALLARIGKGTVYELGSGWGGLAIAISRKNQVYAYEQAIVPWLFSLLRKRVQKFRNLTIQRKDFFSESLASADYVFCYLYPKAMGKLAAKFEKELKKGALVFSNSFQIPGKKPHVIIETNDFWRSKIYCYHY